jgi:hypothetical protein
VWIRAQGGTSYPNFRAKVHLSLQSNRETVLGIYGIERKAKIVNKK